MSFMTVLMLFWLGFCIFAGIILLRKRNYIKTTYAKLKAMDQKLSYNKDIDIVGIVSDIKSVQIPSRPDIYMTKAGSSLENIILDDGTGKFNILHTSTFRNWIKNGDKLNVRGQYCGDSIVNSYEIYNLTTGKKKGRESNLFMMLAGIAMGIAGLNLTGIDITMIDIAVFVIFMILLILGGIYWTKKIANKTLGLPGM